MEESRKILRSLLAAVLVFTTVCGTPRSVSATRLKDLADIEGVRGNQLIGYGLIIGLQGTGDKQGALFTSQSMSNLLERLGIRVSPEQLKKTANVAAVVVTADLPAFSRPGSKMDVTLSSIGDATSLQGGVLVMTPLRGADGKVYAVAQGPVSLGGFIVADGGDKAQKNHPTVARIAKGATVERSIPFDLFAAGTIRIVLREPDFTTVTRVQSAVNKLVGHDRAKAVDSASVVVPLDQQMGASPIQMIAALEDLQVEPDEAARVVINERTGTIIMGEQVRVATVALAHGSLNITIKTEEEVSQPNALAGGRTETVENSEIQVGEEAGELRVLQGSVSLGQVVKALNGLGATPRDLIAIFQALQKAGALRAEIVVM